MKYLVTGGAGYIGSHTSHLLRDQGHDLVVLDNLYSGHVWALPKGVEFVEGNVGQIDLVETLFSRHKFDGILHFAAHIEVEESIRDPIKYYQNNTMAAHALFAAARKAGISKIVFSSTAAVYGEPDVSFLGEEHRLAPINPYGASKMMSERILQDIAGASNGELNYVILRYFNVAGARVDGSIGQATPRATHLIKVTAETALGLRPEVAIYGTNYSTPDGTCQRDYIHVDDLAQAHLDALRYLENGGASDIFNVGYGHPYTVREVVNTMKRISGVDFKVVEQGRRPGDASAIAADNSKIKRVLGWKPKFDDLDLICKTAFEWEKTLRAKKLVST